MALGNRQDRGTQYDRAVRNTSRRRAPTGYRGLIDLRRSGIVGHRHRHRDGVVGTTWHQYIAAGAGGQDAASPIGPRHRRNRQAGRSHFRYRHLSLRGTRRPAIEHGQVVSGPDLPLLEAARVALGDRQDRGGSVRHLEIGLHEDAASARGVLDRNWQPTQIGQIRCRKRYADLRRIDEGRGVRKVVDEDDRSGGETCAVDQHGLRRVHCSRGRRQTGNHQRSGDRIVVSRHRELICNGDRLRRASGD